MWAKALLVVCLGVPLISAGESPNAENVKKILNTRGPRYSDNLIEDANLDVVRIKTYQRQKKATSFYG